MIYYPVNINTKSITAVVYGGGKTAYERIKSLMESHAYVFNISKYYSLDIVKLAQKRMGELELLEGDENFMMDGLCNVVYACTDSDEINEKIHKEYKELNTPVFVEDKPEKSDFIVPEIVEYDSIVVSVNVENRDYNLSKMLKNHIEATLNDELIEKLELIGKIYDKIKEKDKDKQLDKKVYESHISSSLEELRDEYCELYECDSDKGIIEQDENSIEVDDDMIYLSSMYEIDESELPIY